MWTINPETVTSILAIIAALGVLATTIVNAIVSLRVKTAVNGNTTAIEEVHTLVNSTNTAQLARIEQLSQVIAPQLPAAPVASVPPAVIIQNGH